MNSRSEAFAKARDYVFLLLKFRLRSENEILERLKRKNFSTEVAREVIDFLKEKRFIDDNVFAKAWINSRLRKPYGLRRIRYELRQKGVEQEVVEAQVGNIGESYAEADIVVDLIKGKLSKLKGIEPDIAKRRIYAYLIRRGFSPEIVVNSLNRLCKQTS